MPIPRDAVNPLHAVKKYPYLRWISEAGRLVYVMN